LSAGSDQPDRSAGEPSGVTALLLQWRAGDRAALDQLVPLVHEELLRSARRHLRGERPGHTLETAALVNEAYVRLIDQQPLDWQNRAQFLAVTSRLMREILVDHARRRRARKRSAGQAITMAIDELAAPGRRRDVDILALDEALGELEGLAPRQARTIELRYFAGLSIDETAHVLDVSPGTVRRDWTLAKAFLFSRLS
jgi:RNA polymerase sigma factor (TIGR02999 family)